MLRKKSERYFKPISRTPFSTSNNLRNQGWVGQTSLSRAIPTPHYVTVNGHEPAAKGHGGCCGKFPRQALCGITVCTPVNQTGYKAAPCGNCHGHRIKPVVKDFSPLNLQQSQRLERLKRAYFGRRYYGGTVRDGIPKWKCEYPGAKVYHHIGGKLYTNAPYGKGVFYSQGTGMPSMSQSCYISSKLANTKCMQAKWPVNLSPTKDSGVMGRYFFSAEQLAAAPPAACVGSLELDAVGRPTQLSFTLAARGAQRGKYSYEIGRECYVEPQSGASIYDNLRPMRGTDASHFTTLRVAPDGDQFLIHLEPPPAPWEGYLNINLKNTPGKKDWDVLPPISGCSGAPPNPEQVSLMKDCPPQEINYKTGE